MPATETKWSVRGWLERLRNWFVAGRNRPPQYSAAFTSAFVALAAKMAKADGVAVLAEWEAFERFLEVPEHERENVRRVYDLAKGDAAGAVAYAKKINALLAENQRLKREVLECLFCVACSDGILHPDEDTLVAEIAKALDVPPQTLRQVRAFFVRDAESPYEVLGVSSDASDAEIKARYRAVAAEEHPDRATAAGAPPAVVKAANAKLAAINAAYDAIVEERRSRHNTRTGRP